MKTKRTLLLVALFAACNVMAQQQRQTGQHTTISSAAATMTVENLNVHWLAPAKPANRRNNRQPVEGLNPQAWTTIAGEHPNQRVFLDDEHYTTEMPLLWFGHEPWQ